MPQPTSRHRTLSIEWIAALAVTAVAIYLGVHSVSHAGGLWRDEVGSVNTQRAPTFAGMWRLQEFESSPLLWSLLLRAWLLVGPGDGDLSLRLFGALGGLSLIAAAWFVARRAGPGVPLVGLALIAVNPEVVRWSSTVRPWGLGAALGAVAAVALWDAASAPSRRTTIVALAAAVASVQCVYQNAVVLAAAVTACALVAVRRRDWSLLTRPLAIAGIAAVSLLPYIGIISRRGTWNALGQVPMSVAMFLTRAADVIDASGVVAEAGWMMLAVVALYLVARRVTDAGLYFAITAAMGALGFCAFYYWFRYLPQSWYFLGAIALAATALEAAIRTSAPPRSTRIALALGAMAIAAGGFGWASTQLDEPLTNLDAIGRVVAEHAGADDLVVVNPWFMTQTLQRYYRGRAVVTSVPPLDDHAVHRYDLIKARMFEAEPVASLMSQVQQVLVSGHHVWYLGTIDVPADGAIPLLRPPPLPDSGWAIVPYQKIWSLQFGSFLADRVEHGRRVPIAIAGGRLEDSPLYDLYGWRQ